jgi:cbb3-type cytochrome oxidase subunit 3
MKKLALIVGALTLPIVSFAQLTNIQQNIITPIGTIVNAIIPIMFGIALIGFFYGLIMYIFGKEQNKDQAKKTMIWGVVALFVMASIWGLIYFIQQAVGVNQNNAPTQQLIPHVS